MPRSPRNDTIARQWEILKLLPSRPPGIRASELEQKLKDECHILVSKRTVERDLNELSGHFCIECNNKGTPYGWYWGSGKTADLPGLTLADAVSLHIIEELLRPMLPAPVLNSLEQRFETARKKLAALSNDNSFARWAGKVRYVSPAMPLIPPMLDERVLEKVQEAVLQERQLQIGYRARGAEKTMEQIVHPIGLVQRGAISYLVATAFDFDDKRLYAVHRISSAEILPDPAKPRSDSEFANYLESNALHFGSNKLIKLVARVEPDLADILKETPLADDQTIMATKIGAEISATVRDSWQLRWWLLSQGSALTVLAPGELRTDISQTIASMHKKYSDSMESAAVCGE